MLCLLLIAAIYDHHLCALVGQLAGNGGTNAARTAGNNGYFVCLFHDEFALPGCKVVSSQRCQWALAVVMQRLTSVKPLCICHTSVANGMSMSL
jgi:hypothetical protein